MKLAVIKFGGRINGNADGAVGGEVKAAIDLLVKGGNQVHCYTHPNKKDLPLPGAKVLDISDFNAKENYEALVVINGNINYYGGQEPRLEMQNLKLLNSFPGKVVYILFDPMLPLRQYWKGVSSKQDKYNWKNKYSEEEIFILRDDITFISQPYDTDSVQDILNKEDIPFKDIIHYPLYKMHLVFYDRLPFDGNKFIKNGDRVLDLAYGGTFRNKKREDKLIKFYFGYPDDFKVEIFGKIQQSHFSKNKIKGLRPPIFSKSIKHDAVRYKMSSAYATVSIGDKWYEGRNLAQRIYESILSNTITFIDNDLDPHKLVYGYTPQLQKLYVSDRNQVYNFINEVKINKSQLREICDLQFETVKIDRQKFVNDLTNIIGNVK